MPRSPLPGMSGRTWKLLGVLWLLGAGLYIGLTLFPVRFPLVTLPLAGSVTLDEALHFLAFVLLASSFPLAFSSRLLVLVAPIILVLLNIVLEFAQMHIPNRRFSEEDLLAGVLGCVAGTLLGWGVRFYLWRRSRS